MFIEFTHQGPLQHLALTFNARSRSNFIGASLSLLLNKFNVENVWVHFRGPLRRRRGERCIPWQRTQVQRWTASRTGYGTCNRRNQPRAGWLGGTKGRHVAEQSSTCLAAISRRRRRLQQHKRPSAQTQWKHFLICVNPAGNPISCSIIQFQLTHTEDTMVVPKWINVPLAGEFFDQKKKSGGTNEFGAFSAPHVHNKFCTAPSRQGIPLNHGDETNLVKNISWNWPIYFSVGQLKCVQPGAWSYGFFLLFFFFFFFFGCTQTSSVSCMTSASNFIGF